MRTPPVLAVVGLLAAATLTGPPAVARPSAPATTSRPSAYAARPAAHDAARPTARANDAVTESAARPRRLRLRLVLTAPASVPVSVTVRGPRTVRTGLPGGGRRVLRTRLPVGRYVVTAQRVSGPTATPGVGTVYRPVISRRHFRVTRAAHQRLRVRVRFEAPRRPLRLWTTQVTPDRVALAWRLPRQTEALVCQAGAEILLDDYCWTIVSGASTVRTSAVDTSVVIPGEEAVYVLFVQAGDGVRVRADAIRVTPPFPARPVTPREPGTLTRVSVARDGGAPDDVYGPVGAHLSADGRLVVFASDATNLVDGTVGARERLYLHDRRAGTTTLLSDAADGDVIRWSIAADGRTVAYAVPSPASRSGWDVYLRDVASGTRQRIGRELLSPGVGLSGDGSRVVYECGTRFVDQEVCLLDRSTGQTTRLTSPTAGREDMGLVDPVISDSGRYVAYDVYRTFDDEDRSLSYVARFDTRTGRTNLVSHNDQGTYEPRGRSEVAQVIDDGSVLFTSVVAPFADGDPGGDPDLVVYDGGSGDLSRVPTDRSVYSVDPQVHVDAPSMSADGRYVVYQAIDLPWALYGSASAGAFLVDRTTGATTLLTPPPGPQESFYPQTIPVISPDGGHVALSTELALVAGDTPAVGNVYVLDRAR